MLFLNIIMKFFYYFSNGTLGATMLTNRKAKVKSETTKAKKSLRKSTWIGIGIVILIVVLVFPMLVMLIPIAIVAVYLYRRRSSSEDTKLPKFSPLKVPNTIKSLWEIEIAHDIKAFLPWKDAPCLLLLKGFQLVGLGILSLESLPQGTFKLESLLYSFHTLGYGLTYLVSCEPEDLEGRVWNTKILFVLRVRKLILSLNQSTVKETTEEVLKRLEWARSLLVAHLKSARIEALKGDDLVNTIKGLLFGGE